MRVELRSVSKAFGKVQALRDVSLDVAPGTIAAIVGPNGAGKTTLMRCLGGIAVPDRGEVRYDGEPFDRGRMDVRRRFFYLPDMPVAFPEMTVIQHLAMVIRLYGRATDGIDSKVASLLEELDILGCADASLGLLSRGQRYKALLAALLAVDPDVWLVDEPMGSGMDPHGISVFKRAARETAQRGGSVIYTTQIVDVAESFSDRVCVLWNGSVRAWDAAQALRRGAADLDDLLEQLRDTR